MKFKLILRNGYLLRVNERLNLVMTRATRGELAGVEIEEGVLYIARMRPAVPEATRRIDLCDALNQRYRAIASNR